MTRSATLLCAALGFGLAGAAQAQSTVSVYGLMDMAAGQFQAAGADKLWRASSGNMTTSFLGFRGTEDLGGGLKARFMIEHFLRLDSGDAGRFNGDAFWARSAWVGLQGEFGATQLGRNTTPLFVSTLIFNPFGDSFSFSPAIRHHFAGGVGVVLADTGWSNSIAYNSPNFSGLSANLVANLGEGPVAGKNIGGNLLYFGGAFAGTLAFQTVGNGDFRIASLAGFDKQDTVQAGASYNFGIAKLFGQFSNVKTESATESKTKIAQIGASVPLAGGALLASYGTAKTTTSGVDFTRKTASLGYDYNLSKSTDVYAVYMNDKATGLDGGNTVAAGIRHKF